ncbi:hypothetical protein GE21DRAFT_1276531 [Neurospora crassa]|nr:hypothetical protein GE21DRAFT_1276531 [Neurospora crassa]
MLLYYSAGNLCRLVYLRSLSFIYLIIEKRYPDDFTDKLFLLLPRIEGVDLYLVGVLLGSRIEEEGPLIIKIFAAVLYNYALLLVFLRLKCYYEIYFSFNTLLKRL